MSVTPFDLDLVAVVPVGVDVPARNVTDLVPVDGDGRSHHHPVRVTPVGRLVDEDVELRGRVDPPLAVRVEVVLTQPDERLRDAKPDPVLATEHDLLGSPALKPNGDRRVMKHLSKDAALEIDDEHGYLTPHGGRRPVGQAIIQEFGYAAARYLDNSEEQIREAHQHIEAADRADQATEALAASDQRVRSEPRGNMTIRRGVLDGSLGRMAGTDLGSGVLAADAGKQDTAMVSAYSDGGISVS